MTLAVRGGREVAGARAVQLPDGAGLIALVDRSDDVRASLDAADFQPGVKLVAAATTAIHDGEDHDGHQSSQRGSDPKGSAREWHSGPPSTRE
jgi:hypothetical protein